VAEVPVIHAVTTDAIVSHPDFLARAAIVMHALGPRGAVHVRAHDLPARWLLELAEALSARQTETGAWLVVNDRVDIALAVGARAVQLTTRSLTPADARRAAAATGRALAIGASVHTVDEARAASDAGAMWVVAGHVYATPAHAGDPGRGLDAVRAICQASTIPVIAIGGVRPDDVGPLRAAGAYGVAAVRGIWRADDAEDACVRYLFEYDRSGARASGGTAAHSER
jgi:thiamine-phosphate diphosphorylase